MIVNIPKDIEEDFKSFLELALQNLEEQGLNDDDCTEAEQEILNLVRKIINTQS